MAADVSYLVRVMNGGDSNEPGKSTAPITRDLLGGSCTLDSQELDLDLQVPCGWEKRLDLKSGKVYLQRSNSEGGGKPQNMSSTSSKLQDLNFPPSSKKTLNLLDSEPALDLKLVSPTASSSNYQSVCTLDKVKSALQRAEREGTRKRSSASLSKSSASPRSTSSSSVMDVGSDLDREEKSSSTGSVATGCPRCLLYVLISRSDPKCPQCNSVVPLPGAPAAAGKKPRIDLNISM